MVKKTPKETDGDSYKPGDLSNLLFKGTGDDSSKPSANNSSIEALFAPALIENSKSRASKSRVTPEEAAEVDRILKAAEEKHKQRELEADPKNNKKKKERVRLLKAEREALEAAGGDDDALEGAKKKKSRKIPTKAVELEVEDEKDTESEHDSEEEAAERVERGVSSDEEGPIARNRVVSKAGEQPIVAAKGKETKVKKKDDAQKEARTVFVGNVPAGLKVAKIKAHFKSYGKIESVRVRSVAVEGTKVDDHGNQDLVRKACINQGKLNSAAKDSMNAYIVFENEAGAQAALAADGSILNEHTLRVDTATPAAPDPKKSIFLGNLPFDVKEDEVRHHFDNAVKGVGGRVTSVRIIRDSETQMGRGFGYVHFNDVASVGVALRLDGTLLRKRAIRVKVCGKRTKGTRGEAPQQPEFEGRRATDGALRRVGAKRKLEDKHGIDKTGKKIKKPRTNPRRVQQQADA